MRRNCQLRARIAGLERDFHRIGCRSIAANHDQIGLRWFSQFYLRNFHSHAQIVPAENFAVHFLTIDLHENAPRLRTKTLAGQKTPKKIVLAASEFELPKGAEADPQGD